MSWGQTFTCPTCGDAIDGVRCACGELHAGRCQSCDDELIRLREEACSAAIYESFRREGPYREPAYCSHGIVFDSKEAEILMRQAKERGESPSQAIRQRFPRLFGKCPLGCGYDGIAYASREHFVMGDW